MVTVPVIAPLAGPGGMTKTPEGRDGSLVPTLFVTVAVHVYVALVVSTPTSTGVVGLVAFPAAPKSLDVHDAP